MNEIEHLVDPNRRSAAREKIRSGRQLRAARALVGLSQSELAREVGTTTRSIRAWEGRDGPPSEAPIFAGKVEAALARRGVVFFSRPTLGVRLSV